MSNSEYWSEFMHRRLSRRNLLKAGTVAGAGLWLGSALGCNTATPSKPETTAQAGGTPAPQRGGILRFTPQASAEYSGFDPYQLNHFADPVYERLVKYSPLRDKFLPSLADSWEMPDDTTYVFHMKPGVKFHNVAPVNGRECTAEDAKYSVERSLSKGGAFNLFSYYTTISKAEVVDKYTFKVTTSEPFAPLLNNMALQNDFVMPKEIVDSDNQTQYCIGTGPFIFDHWDKGDKLVYRRNPDYHIAGQPYLDGIEHRWVVDYTTAVAVFLSDQCDITTVYAQDMKTIKSKRPSTQILPGASLTHRRFSFNATFTPTNDLRVRQAMDLVMPREEITFKIAGGTKEEIPFAYTTSTVSHFLENWAIPMSELRQRTPYMIDYPKDQALAQAKKLMADAGYPNGFEMDAVTVPEQYALATTVMAQDYWAQLGIKVTIKQLDTASWTAAGFNGAFQCYVNTIGLANPDPDGQIYPYFRTGAASNYNKWSDPELDKMLDQQRATVDVAKRKQIVLDAQRRILDTVASIPTYDWVTYICVSDKVHNLPVVNAGSFRGWDYLGEVWMSK